METVDPYLKLWRGFSVKIHRIFLVAVPKQPDSSSDNVGKILNMPALQSFSAFTFSIFFLQ